MAVRKVRAISSRDIGAPAGVAYGILADYREAHPAILPSPPFEDYCLLAGGQGAGTEISFVMRAFGGRHVSRGTVSEPEPGRRLVEYYPESDVTTSFTVDSLATDRCRVTIATEWEAPIPRVWIERLFAPRFLRRVFDQELDNLARRATRGLTSTRTT